MSAPILLSNGFDVQQFIIRNSNGDEFSTVTTEEDEAALFSGDSLQENAAEEEEWSGENTPYCFYFVKQFAYNDPEIKTKIDEADTEIYHCNNDRIHLANRLKSKRAERLALVASIENSISSQEVITEEIYSLSERLSEVKIEIELLDNQMACVLDQRDKAFERIKNLRIQRDKGNAAFFHSRVVIKKAIELANSGNVRDLEELSSSEVDKFMSRWNNDKAFREDYKKRILPTLDERKLSRDGRIKKSMEVKRLCTEEESDDEKLGKTDEETLKAKKRGEEIEKARLAMERKRKLHDKAAAKAAVRVKKEAEKKLKELEKRAEKKKTKKAVLNSSSSSDLDRTMEIVTELEKEKLLKRRSVKSFRFRYHGKGNETVPKAILKRRKAHRLWIWTVSSGVLALALALILVFFYVR